MTAKTALQAKSWRMTWQLWRGLQYPSRSHPLFKQAVQPSQPAKQRLNIRNLILLGLVVINAGILSQFAPDILLPMLLTAALGIPLFFLVFSGTLIGVNWVGAVSQAIAEEHIKERYDLLSTTEQGGLGVHWLICTGIMHRDNSFKRLYRVVRAVASFALALTGLAFGLLIIRLLLQDTEFVIIVLRILPLSILVLFAWLDYIQSIITSALIAMILPTYFVERTWLNMVATLLYLAVQVSVYVIILLAYLGIAALMTALGLEEDIHTIMSMLVTLPLFYLLRETVIAALYQLLLRRL